MFVVALLLAAAVGLRAQNPDRSKPPALGPAPSLKMPAIQKTRLGNGLQVWIVEHHEVPLVQVDLVIRSGSAADPIGKYGVGSLTAAMLDEGAGSRSALEIADAIDFLGATIATSSAFDLSAVRLSAPVARLGEALPVMADIALRPSFPQAELDRLRKERLTALLQAKDDTASIVQIAFPRVVFGPIHRYGTTGTGLPPALEAMTVDDLRAFYRSHYRPDNAAVVVVGDVTPAAVMPMLEKAFGAWKTDGIKPLPVVVPMAPQLTRRQVFLIDKPGAAQSQIRIGWVGVPRSTPDYVTLQVLNSILGGAYSSRLNQNLRETHGYTYGASSAFDMRGSAGPFLAAAAVQTDKTADALKEFFVELDGILALVPQAELDRAKNYVALAFPGEFETTGDLARKLEELIAFNLPDDTFANFVGAVGRLTAADLQRAAARYIQPEKMAVVVVGDRGAIEGAIRGLNLGPLQVVPIDDFFK